MQQLKKSPKTDLVRTFRTCKFSAHDQYLVTPSEGGQTTDELLLLYTFYHLVY